MQRGPWKVHILNLARSVKLVKDVGQLFCVLGLNSFLRPIEKELLKPFVPKAFYHL